MDGLTVIIPVYNEEEILEASCQKLSHYLNSNGISYEIIVVDNGSTDRTREIGERLSREYPEVAFYHMNERSVGGAFWTAVTNAKFEKVATVDVDLSIDIDFLKSAYNELNSCDILVGSKVSGSQERSIVRVLGSKAYILFANKLLNTPATDFSIGAKAYRKEKILKYAWKTSTWTGYVIELLSMAASDGLLVKEVPVGCNDTRKGRFNILHEGFYRYWHLFKLWYKVKLNG